MSQEQFAQNIEEYCQKFGEVFQDVYDEVKRAVNDKLHDTSCVVDFLIAAMVAVTKYSELHGLDKKELVHDVVYKVVDDMTIDEEEKTQLKNQIAPYLGPTIEILICAAKSRLFLEKFDDVEGDAEDVYNGCYKGCLPKAKSKAKSVKRKGKSVPIESGAIEDLGVIIYDKLRGMIANKHIDISNIMTIVAFTMQLVQQYPTLEGIQKKLIVKKVIYRLINEIPLSEGDRAAILILLNGTIDKTIDYIIAIANGEIDLIGQLVEVVGKISTSCAGCCGKKQE